MMKLTTVVRKNKWLVSLSLIVIFGLLASRSLFIPGFYSSHDGVSHVVRLANFYQGLIDGQLIPRWSGNLAWGLGSPVLMYYGPLPYLLGLIPKLLGASLSSSIEIITGLSLVASGITFFLWSKEIFGERAALVGSLFYMWAPYRFLDIYVRGAYPENFTFIFPPLILLSAQKIFNKSEREGFVLGAASLSAIILSHNVMALFFLPVFVLYSTGFYLMNKDLKRLLIAASCLISSFLLTSFYWLPAFFEKKEVYLNNLDASGSYLNNFVSIGQIVYSKWGWGPLDSTSPMSLQLGVAHQVLVLIGVVGFFAVLFKKNIVLRFFTKAFNRLGFSIPIKVKKVELFHFVFFLALFLLSLFLMTKQSLLLWDNVPLLSFALYPWRFLAIGIFVSAALSSYVVKVINPSLFWIILFLGLLLYSHRNYSQLVGKIHEGDSLYYDYQDTADIWGEYLPISADLEIIKECRLHGCKFDKIIASKDSRVEVIVDKSNLLAFSYNSQGDFTATVNTFYFPGWNLYLDNILYEGVSVNKSGTMDISLPKGVHEFALKFEDTNFRRMALLVSFTGLLGSGIYLIWLKEYLKS